MAEEHGAWRDLSDEIEQFLTVGMGGEVEVLHFAASGDFAGAAAEYKCRAVFCRLEPAAGRVRVGVADEKNRLAFVADHAGGKVMRGGVFAHHPGGEHKDSAAGQLHGFKLRLVEHDQVKGFGEAKIRMLSMGAMGLVGPMGMTGATYFAGALLLGLAFLAVTLQFARSRSAADARRVFFGSITYLPLLWILMIVNKI